MIKKNILVIGASGGVASAFLQRLTNYMSLVGKIILVDKSDKILNNPYIDHKYLDYKFMHREISVPEKEDEYIEILDSQKINIVIDLTDMDSIPTLDATNKYGASYINTAMNDENRMVYDLVQEMYAKKMKINNAAHILCSGMNPGIVNMWVQCGIEKYGVPQSVTHFEYDSSTIAAGWKPMMTWSLKEFIVESVRDPSGIMLGKDKVKYLYPNSLKHRVDMEDLLAPITKLDKYPQGCVVLHEENVSVSQKYNIPSQFIYAYNQQTMDRLIKMYGEKRDVNVNDLIHGDNTSITLVGSDDIGVMLQYDKKRVYYFNSAANKDAAGTNGTYSQTVVGVLAALQTVLVEKNLEKQIYFTEDLYGTSYKDYIFKNMKVERFVYTKPGK